MNRRAFATIRTILPPLAWMLRWLFATAAVTFLIRELIRVVSYVVTEWGAAAGISDGAVLYKIGEFAVLLPFFVFIHWNGAWSRERAYEVARMVRWWIWGGGVLVLMAAFDLFGRVRWAWWTVPLLLLAILLPILMTFMAKRKAVWRGYMMASLIGVLMAIHYITAYVLTGYFIVPLPSQPPSPAATASERWQQDLDYLADNLVRLHVDAFHSVDSSGFYQEVGHFREAIPGLSREQVKAGFYRIVALVSDGHTCIDSWSMLLRGTYPVQLRQLIDGLYVIGVRREYKHLLGSRVQKIGDLAAGVALDSVQTLIPNESHSYVIMRGAQYLTDADFLIALEIADTGGSVELTCELVDGDTARTILVPSMGWSRGDWIWLPDESPFYESHHGEEFWSEFFDSTRTAYLKYNRFTNPLAFPKFTDKFWKEVELKSCEYIIVDFRGNVGGYSPCFDRFYRQILLHDNINKSGHLYVLTDRGTFSSATLWIGILKRDTEALIAGEEMGGSLNHYGDMRAFTLPNSGIAVNYSVQYFETWPDSLPKFAIDIPIAMNSEQYFAAADPVMDSVLSLIRADMKQD